MFLLEFIKTIIALSLFSCSHGVLVKAIYERLAVPSGDTNTDIVKALIYIMSQILAPILAMQWLVFEVKAISRLKHDDRFAAKQSDKPSVFDVLNRV